MNIKRIINPLVFPVISYTFFLTTKALGIEPEVDDIGGLHAFLGIFYLFAGFSVSYLMVILGGYRKIKGFWIPSGLLFLLLAVDASIGIHEVISWYLFHSIGLSGSISELIPYSIYFILIVTILIIWNKQFGTIFWIFMISFFCFAGIAELGDSLSKSHEGTFILKGSEFSYEQILETLSFLCLCAAFTSEAIKEIIHPIK